MDIVDTFNHLIPTEHLDDALFLGSNLENEGCDDFTASHNVLEDSLKNMLSDKDPMLGSASTQFCLPDLDSNDPNFQMPCSTDSVRNLRQSTLAKRSSTSSATNTKKSPTKSASVQKEESKQDKCPKPSDSVKEEKDDIAAEDEKEIQSSNRLTGQIEQALPMVEIKPEDQSQTLMQGKVDEISDELRSCSLLSDDHSSTEPLDSQTAAATKSQDVGPALLLSVDSESNEAQDDNIVKKEMNEVVGDIIHQTQSAEDSGCKTNEVLQAPEENACEIAETAVLSEINSYMNQNEVINDTMLQPVPVVKGTGCNSGLETPTEDADNNEVSKEGPKTFLDTKDEDTDLPGKLLENLDFGTTDSQSVQATGHEPETSVSDSSTVHECQDQKAPLHQDSVKEKFHNTSKTKESHSRQGHRLTKCLKKRNPKKSKAQKNQVATGLELSTSNQDMKQTKMNLVSVKTVQILHKQTSASMKQHENPCLNTLANVKKIQATKDVKTQRFDQPLKVVKKQMHALKKVSQTQAHKSFVHPLDDKLETQHGTSKEIYHSVSLHGQSQSGHLAHSNQKQLQKHQFLTSSKSNNQVKEEGGHNEPQGLENLKEDEKLKIKRPDKNLQPRQRRSSKSISLDEPPLFIPDNIATVKKESSEHHLTGDSKNVWASGKHCGFCKTPHGNRFMVGCGRCDEWFHGDCVGLSLSQAQQLEEDDKEYVCVKCCVEEDRKIESFDQSKLDSQDKTDQENRTMEYDKPGISKQPHSNCPGAAKEKTRLFEDTVKHKVRIIQKDSGKGRVTLESKELENKKLHLASVRKMTQTTTAPRRSSEEKNEKLPKDSTNASSQEEKILKSGIGDKQEIKKKKPEKKGPASNVHASAPSTPKPSVDQIRQSVRHSLKEILLKRLSASTSKIPEERAAKVAAKIERELFSFYRDTDSKYKNKYRSLMFNLKDPKNNVLYKRVLKGEITPDHLIRMSPEELASRELAAWRQRENRHTIEMIEKEQREVERRPITKITHKGEIEIESETAMKEPEVMEVEDPSNKPVEKTEEIQKDKEVPSESTSDTTTQHKNHLFDLNCKICTGRMAPPADDLSPKKVKVASGVARKHSDNEAENLADALSSTSNILTLDLAEEEKPESPKETLSSTGRSEIPVNNEDESTFLTRLSYIWKGFINMPSVAKFVIKAYPVSGSLEYLTEDLPDSIQVGGRISPQTVWDYVEKLKASGTKETCVIRFSPVTEEDQISYTLLYAYFSSRKRYGVVANNMRQVKDMYLIPLGASEKVPHYLVPFDGPGLEAHRPNLLLALIIRQKLKRQHSTSLDDESPGSVLSSIPPEKRNKTDASNEEEDDEDENDFFNSFTAVLHKNRNRSQQSETEEVQTVVEPVPPMIKREPPKPLRFLPGVLVGWENQASTLELASKPLPVDDILQSLLGTTENVFEYKESISDLLTTEEKPLLDEQTNINTEKTVDVVTAEITETVSQLEPQESTESAKVLPTSTAGTSNTTGTLTCLSLKGKPPDVSTEAFLANLPSVQVDTIETEESKEKEAKFPLPEQDISNEPERTNSGLTSVISHSSKDMDNNVNTTSVESIAINISRSPKFIHIKRDPRQAFGRSQQVASDFKDEECNKNEEIANQLKERDQILMPENEQTGLGNQPSGEKEPHFHQTDISKGGIQYTPPVVRKDENSNSSKIEITKELQEDAVMQNVDTMQSFKRGPAGNTFHVESENAVHSDFLSKGSTIITSGNFSQVRPQQPNFQHPPPPPFAFQSPPHFPPHGSVMFGFPPHIPPPPLLPPGFGFLRPPSLRFHSAESGVPNPMVPWPPVHLLGPAPHYIGPVAHGPPLTHEQSRYSGSQKFYHSKDNRGQERRHSDPWDRQDQHLERGFSSASSQRRQRFYSDSHRQRRERQHEKELNTDRYWDQDSERNRRRERDRNQEKEKDRKKREDVHKDKERSRLSHSDRSSDSKTSRDSRNPERHTNKLKSEERVHDKEREKSRDRNREKEGGKDRDRHHKDRDHSDRGKNKR
ncbi:PHD finger protein 3 isoform X2 [Rhinatrema bivittatum]|uniref:PHD finger protein 3 isoform X2 n=1 Tax=Rhinatrema bivittatum TaxID=194408 RepID=UPI001129057A|nr:PHD finger protein 3 isoform X2 [Rhinatrema bivittatum]